jgi:hypothetical protein
VSGIACHSMQFLLFSSGVSSLVLVIVFDEMKMIALQLHEILF